MKKIIICFILMFGLVACGTEKMSLPTPQVQDQRDIVGHCSNADGGFQLFGLIPIYMNGRLERAYNKCMDSVDAESLTNVEVVDRWFWTPLGNGFISVVEGDGVNTNR